LSEVFQVLVAKRLGTLVADAKFHAPIAPAVPRWPRGGQMRYSGCGAGHQPCKASASGLNRASKVTHVRTPVEDYIG
jgi:hypothetical protein